MTIYCSFCQEPIPDKVIKRRRYGVLPQRMYCDRPHTAADRRRSGFFAQMGAQGNHAQAEIKRQTGKAPGVRGGARPGAGKRSKQ